jgi:deoxyadenosine/deoxycytidine kinase
MRASSLDADEDSCREYDDLMEIKRRLNHNNGIANREARVDIAGDPTLGPVVAKQRTPTLKIYDGIKIDSKFINNFKGKIVEVVGFPGSGKSTICDMFVKQLESYGVLCKHIKEHIENELFDKMIKNPKKFAYVYQYIMLKHRIATRKEAQKHLVENPNACIIIDGGLITDYSFSCYHVVYENIDREEFVTYIEKLKNESKTLCLPDLILHVRCQYDVQQKQLKMRGRPEEMLPTPDARKDLQKSDKKCVYDYGFYCDMNVIYEYIERSQIYDNLINKTMIFDNDVFVPEKSMIASESQNLMLKNLNQCLMSYRF